MALRPINAELRRALLAEFPVLYVPAGNPFTLPMRVTTTSASSWVIHRIFPETGHGLRWRRG